MEEKQASGMGCSWKKSKHMEQNVRGRKVSKWNGMFMEEKQAYGAENP